MLKAGCVQAGRPPLIPRNWLVPPMGKRARPGVALVKRRSPAVVSGVCPSARDPERLLNPGCRQLALPLTEIPVAQLLLPHWVGLEAKAVAVAAFPVVLLVSEAGRSVATKVRKEGFPLALLGAA